MTVQIGRYLKKLPLSASRLRHYKKGETLNVRYLDHRSGTHQTLSISPSELILRLIEHIPDKHFKMIRYYGFLANRHRSALLPKAYVALGNSMPEKRQTLSYRTMMINFLRVNPFTCICLLYTSPSPRDGATSRMPSSA